MNILMLNPPFENEGKFSREQRSPAITKSGTLYYPMWLAYATGMLEKNEYNVKLVDAPARSISIESIVKIVTDFKPSLIVVDTSTPSIYNDINIAVRLKNIIKYAKLVLVGPHVSATPEETLNLNIAIDIIARGEYDFTLCDIAKVMGRDSCANTKQYISDLTEIKGISFRDGNKIIHTADRKYHDNLDELPFVSQVYKKWLNYKDYFYAHSQYPIVTIIAGRGCTFKCNYCVYPQVFSGRKSRYRSVENIVDEMEYIIHEYTGVKEIMFEDDTLTLNRERCRNLCNEILKRKVKIKWSCNSRATVDYDTLKIMRLAGCRLLCVGFESGDQNILDNINKGIKLDTMRKFALDARKAGMLIHGCFMVGNKGETKETMQKTLEFAKELAPDTAQFFPIMVYPGTSAYDWAKQSGYLKASNYTEWLTKDGLHNCVVSREKLSGIELNDFCGTARRNFYLRGSYVAKKILQMTKSPFETRRTLRAFKTFAKYLVKKQ